MFDINFIAYAIDLENDSVYEDFLVPFTFFSLLFNKNSHVEMIVLDPDNFKRKYSKEIASIKEINGNFLIRGPQYKPNRNVPNTYRFFEVPTVRSKYTFISDVDIMCLEDILPNYLSNWPVVGTPPTRQGTKNNLVANHVPSVLSESTETLQTKATPTASTNGLSILNQSTTDIDNAFYLPYSNMIREKHDSRLTGVMMVKSDTYYTDDFIECQKKYYNMNKSHGDEDLLGWMCKEIHGMPDLSFRLQRVYGIHFSPNRGSEKVLGLETSKRYYDLFLGVVNKYRHLFDYDIFRKLLSQLYEHATIARSLVRSRDHRIMTANGWIRRVV